VAGGEVALTKVVGEKPSARRKRKALAARQKAKRRERTSD
jgi:hypothetical protein